VLHFGAEDLDLLTQMYASTSRRLVPPPASPDDWLAVLGRWKLTNMAGGVRPKQKEEYEYEVFGLVNFGSWVNGRIYDARGVKGVSADKVARAQSLMQRMADTLGLLDENWWKAK